MQREAQAIGLSCLLLATVSCTYKIVEATAPTLVTRATWANLDAAYLPGTTVLATLALSQADSTAATAIPVMISSASATDSNVLIAQLDDMSDAQGQVHVLVSALIDANINLSASLFAQNANKWLSNVGPPLTIVFNTQAANANSGTTTGNGTPLHATLTAPPTAVTGIAGPLVVAFTDNANQPANFTGTLHFSSSDGGASLPNDTNVTGLPVVGYNPGVTFHSVNGAPPTIQTVQVTARQSGGSVLTGTASVSVSPASSYFTVVASPASVAVGAATSLTVTLYDQNGTVAASPTNAAIYVSAPHDPLATLSGAVTMTSNPYTWPNAVTFHASGTQAALVANNSNSIQGAANVNVTAGNVNTLVFLPSASAAAGISRTVSVQAVDVYGNVVSTYSGTITFSLAAAGALDPNAFITPVTVTAQQGVAQTNVTCTRMPSCTVDATDGTFSASTTLAITPSDPASIRLVASNSNVTAGVYSTATVTAADIYGNAVTNFTSAVTFSLSNQTALQQNITTSGGTMTVSYLPTVAGTNVALSAYLASAAFTSTTYININPGAPAKVASACPSCPLTAGVNGNFVVSVMDNYNNITPNFTGTINLTTSDTTPNITFSASPNHSYTPSDAGVHTFSIMLGHAGTDVVSGSGAFTFSTQLNVNPGAYATMGLILNPLPQVAGQNANLTMTAYDAFSNVKTDYMGSGTFTCTDIPATIPATWSFAASNRGVLNVSGFTFATHSTNYKLIVHDGLTNPNIQLDVISGPPVAITFMNWPSAVAANAAFTFNVATIDSMGNTSGWNGNLTFSSSDSVATLPATFTATTSDGGYHYFVAKLHTTGSQTVTVADTANVLADDVQSVTVLSVVGPPSQFSIASASGSNPNACEPAGLTVTVEDASGNMVTSANFPITLTASGSGAGTMQGNTTAVAVGGVATFNGIFFTNEAAALNYTITANGNGIVSTNTITVQPATGPVVNIVSATQTSTGCVDITYNVQGSCGDAVNFAGSTTPGAPSSYFYLRAASGTPFGDMNVGFQDGNVTFTWDATRDLPHFAGAMLLNFGDAQTYPLAINNTGAFLHSQSVVTPVSGTVATVFQNYKSGVRYAAYASSSTITLQAFDTQGAFNATSTTPFPGMSIGSLAASNLNHDGNNYLVGCVNGNTIAVWPIDPNTNAIATPQTYGYASCGALQLVDLNHDNQEDVVTVANGNALLIIPNSGNVHSMFSGATPYAVAGNVVDFRVGNVRNNGAPDIVAITDSPSIWTYQNANATATFPNAIVRTLPSLYGSMALGDIDRDGKADVAIGQISGAAVWLRGDGTGIFDVTNPIATASAGVIHSLVDMDKNGFLDVLSFNSNQIAVTYGQNGNLITTTATPMISSTNFARIAVVDIDRNGYPDLLTFPATGGSSSVISSYLQRLPLLCSNSMDGVPAIPITTADLLGVPGDFDGDSKTDMVFVSPPNLRFYTGDGADSLVGTAITSNVGMGNVLSPPAAADINGDGNMDIALMEHSLVSNANVLRMYAGNGHGGFTAMGNVIMSGSDASFTNVTLYDVNNDGTMDAVVGIQNSPDLGGGIAVLNSIATLQSETRWMAASGAPLAYLQADTDMNGDGSNDVVAFTPTDANSVHVFTFAGSGLLAASAAFGGIGVQAMAVGKVSSSSLVQVVTASVLPLGTLNVYFWNGAGVTSVAPGGALDRSCVTQAMRIKDLDRTSYDDLAVLCYGQGRVLTLYNTGSGSFGYQTDIPLPMIGTQMFVTDFDTDGAADIAVIQPGIAFAAAHNKANAWNPQVAAGFVGGDTPTVSVTNANNINVGFALQPNTNGYIDATYVTLSSGQANQLLIQGNGLPQWPLATSPGAGVQFLSPTGGTFIVVAGDLNQDGISDTVVSDQGDNEQVIVYDGGVGSQTLAQANVAHMALGDFNGDSWPDIAMVSGGTSPVLTLYFGAVTAPYVLSTSISTSVLNAPNGVNAITVGKVNPNTRDAVIVDTGTGFEVYALTPGSGFSLGGITSYGSVGAGTAAALRVLDWDHDGINDVVLEFINSVGTSIAFNVYSGKGDGTFQLSVNLPTLGTTSTLSGGKMSIADFDGDGFLDIAAPIATDAIAVYSTSPQAFPLRYYMESAGIQTTAAADINRDGITDLTVLVSPANSSVPMTHHIATLLGR